MPSHKSPIVYCPVKFQDELRSDQVAPVPSHVVRPSSGASRHIKEVKVFVSVLKAAESINHDAYVCLSEKNAVYPPKCRIER